MSGQISFKKAVKKNLKLRAALIGPPGSGKSYTSLGLACCLGQRVAVIDTESGSASKYADLFQFDVLELTTFSPQSYVDALAAAAQAGYEVVVIDSLSHAWVGTGGALDIKENVAARIKNDFAAWKEVTPLQNAMVQAILNSPCHVIATMRSKVEYVVEENERGKKVPKKVGTAPVQRDGLEYEFDLVGEMDQENTLVVTKSRCPSLAGQVIRKPGRKMAQTLQEWLTGGAKVEPSTEQPKVNGTANGEASQQSANSTPPVAPEDKAVAEWRIWLHEAPGIDQLNARLPQIGSLQNGTKEAVKKLVAGYAHKQGWTLDVKAKKYAEPAAQGEAHEPEGATA